MNYQTMSLIAQQLMAIQKKIKASAENIVLENFTLKLNPSCAIFVTSNPYETNGKISNNLKLLFRPVTIAKPDVEIILWANFKIRGYDDPKRLAKKLAKFYDVLCDRVNPHCSYEFGLRNLLVVVDKAARSNASIHSIAQELARMHRPKLIGNDLDIFNSIMEQMFGTTIEETNDCDSASMLPSIAAKRNIFCTPYIQRKTMEMKCLLDQRIPIVVLGKPCSGKTTCITLVQDLIEEEVKLKVKIWI